MRLACYDQDLESKATDWLDFFASKLDFFEMKNVFHFAVAFCLWFDVERVCLFVCFSLFL